MPRRARRARFRREACQSVGAEVSYRKNEDYYTDRHPLRARLPSGAAPPSLNVGPMADGTVPEATAILKRIGSGIGACATAG